MIKIHTNQSMSRAQILATAKQIAEADGSFRLVVKMNNGDVDWYVLTKHELTKLNAKVPGINKTEIGFIDEFHARRIGFID